MSDKAIVIEKRHSKQCDICMIIDAEDKTVKWHLYKDGFSPEDDSYICGNCLNDLKGIREKCHHKVDNPNNKELANFIPWWFKDIPELRNKFKKDAF